MNEEEKKAITLRVSKEIATIYKLNGLDFYALSAKERDVVVQVFQCGVGFIEKVKAEEIKKSIDNFNKQIPF